MVTISKFINLVIVMILPCQNDVHNAFYNGNAYFHVLLLLFFKFDLIHDF